MKQTLKAISESSGVSQVSLRQWKRDGIDIHDPQALADRVALMNGGPDSELMKRERLRKLRAEASLAEHLLAQRRAEVLDVDTVTGLFIALTHACMAQLKRMPAELPGQLEGASPAAMRGTLEAFRDNAIMAIRTEMEGVFNQLEINQTNENQTKA